MPKSSSKYTVEALQKSLGIVLLTLMPAGSAWSDTPLVDTSRAGADSVIQVDTALYQPGNALLPYTPVNNPTDFEKHLTQNPTLALFKSMFVPGLGQIGNRRYVKAVVFAGLDAWFVGSAIHYGRQAAVFRREFDNAALPAARNQWYDLYQDRKDERNKFTWFAVIVTFISMFDAYVDAHLSGFPRKERDHEVALGASPDGVVSASVVFFF
ncbi:MAG TPA: DUF5683 domain-containing protein [Candidatus Deferrimicrobium sp.]|nr:DUF5683 domain-containing protein [Candidatus Deferrimicrobium sp.]